MTTASAAPGRRARRGSRRRAVAAAVAVTVAVVVVGGLPARADPVPSPGPTTTTTATAPPATAPPATSAPPGTSAAPTPAPPSCAPQDCIPQPGSSAPTEAPAPGVTSPPPDAGGGPGGITGWITKGINAAIGAFFKTIITAALNPLLKLLGDTLLATPSLSSLPRVGELWQNSWEIVLAVYGILIALAGIVLMSYESLQSRYSVKEIAPRIPVGLLAAGLSLFLAGKAVDLANALSHAVMGAGAEGEGAGNTLATFVLSSFVPGADLFTDIMWVVVIGVLVALLITYVVRVALTVILVAGAPLALMCHALPQTDGIARWWWRTFGGVLAIQVAQSLTLITGIRVFLNSGGLAGKGLFGGVSSGLVNLLVTLALTYILFKIPFWILGSVRVGQGRSFAGRAVRAYLMYQTLGMLRGAGNTRAAVRSGPNGGGAPRRPGGGPVPVAPRRAVNPAAAAPVARRRPPGQPLFRSPGQSPQAAASPRRAAGPPPMPTFQAPGAPGTPAPVPRPAQPPGMPTFRAPAAPARVRPGARPVGPPPRQPLFRQPVPANPVQPRRVTAPPPPATFREPRPRAGAAQVPPPPRRTPPGGDRR